MPLFPLLFRIIFLFPLLLPLFISLLFSYIFLFLFYYPSLYFLTLKNIIFKRGCRLSETLFSGIKNNIQHKVCPVTGPVKRQVLQVRGTFVNE